MFSLSVKHTWILQLYQPYKYIGQLNCVVVFLIVFFFFFFVSPSSLMTIELMS